MSGVKGDPCGNRKARAPRPAYRGAKTAPRAVFRARVLYFLRTTVEIDSYPAVPAAR